jgi:hypothetical protein
MLILIISSCTEKKYDLSSKKDIIVNGFFSSIDTFRVNLSYSENISVFQKDSFINNAEIFLELPDHSVLELTRDHFKYGPSLSEASGYYKSPGIIPYEAGEYKLQVNVPNYDAIIATDIIPKPIAINYYSFHIDTIGNSSFFLLGFRDPATEENYYAISLNIFEYFTTWFSDKDSLAGGYYSQINSSIYNASINSSNTFVDASIKGGLAQIIFSDRNLSHSPDKTIIRIDYEGPKPYYSEDDSVIFELQLLSISKKYYDYSIDYYLQDESEKQFYTDPVNVYSNIKGGYGIFAGYNRSTARIVYSNGEIHSRN